MKILYEGSVSNETLEIMKSKHGIEFVSVEEHKRKSVIQEPVAIQAKRFVKVSDGPTRNDLMLQAKEKGIKNFRVLNKEELQEVLTSEPERINTIVLTAVQRWRSGWGKRAAAVVAMLFMICNLAFADTNDKIADAIYKAEGGSKTKHPYGILIKYKHTTPRQACLNTIAHAKRDWNGKGDFIVFLGNRYCPVGAKNDPQGLNKNWIRNVKYFLAND